MAHMKIVHYFPKTSLSVGGSLRAAMDLTGALAQRGLDLTWLTIDDVDAPETWKQRNPNTPRVVALESMDNASAKPGIGPRKRRRDRVREALTARLNRTNPSQNSSAWMTATQYDAMRTIVADADIVHLHSMWFRSNVQLVHACQETGTPWVVSTHGMLNDFAMERSRLKKKVFLSTFAKALLHDAALVVATADEEKRQVEQWVHKDNVVSIPLILDLEPYAAIPSPDLATERFGDFDGTTVLFVGRIDRVKSIETLIGAVEHLRSRKRNVRLLVAGRGDDVYWNELQALAKERGLAEHVQFLGLVVDDLKLSLYAMSDVFALPSEQENFGLTFPESMLCETPVIATKGADIWRELEKSGGAQITARTPEAFADAIDAWAKDDAARRQAGRAAREHILSWLDTDRVAAQYKAMYERALQSDPSADPDRPGP